MRTRSIEGIEISSHELGEHTNDRTNEQINAKKESNTASNYTALDNY